MATETVTPDPRLAAAADLLSVLTGRLSEAAELLRKSTSDLDPYAMAGAAAMVQQAGLLADQAAQALGKSLFQEECDWWLDQREREIMAALQADRS